MAAQLIVALDLPRKEDALVLARELQGAVPWCKVGMELFTLAGPDIIRELHDLGFHVFLDMKFYDIPHTVAQAVKTAVFAAKVMELLGYDTEPHSDAVRHDIIQMIHMKEPEALKKFCRGIQFGAPVDSYVTPEPWDMPGYDCPVIMAAGAFIQGASIELSADAPMRPPYTVYLQGGLTFESGRLGVLLAVQELLGRS